MGNDAKPYKRIGCHADTFAVLESLAESTGIPQQGIIERALWSWSKFRKQATELGLVKPDPPKIGRPKGS